MDLSVKSNLPLFAVVVWFGAVAENGRAKAKTIKHVKYNGKDKIWLHPIPFWFPGASEVVDIVGINDAIQIPLVAIPLVGLLPCIDNNRIK